MRVISGVRRWVGVSLMVFLAASFAPPATAAAVVAVTGFGKNPGNLKMVEYVPDGLKAGAPLVVALHGCGQTAEGFGRGTGWIALAERAGFALLLPEQQESNQPRRCFNWYNGHAFSDYLPWYWPWFGSDIDRDHGEARSIASMIETTLGKHRLDVRRVFVTGLSGGGAMTAVMLAAYPELFAGGAIVAGVPYRCATDLAEAISPTQCGVDYATKKGAATIKSLPAGVWGDKVRDANRAFRGPWPRVSIWHGTADGTVIPGAADELAKQWLNVHGLDGSPGTPERPPEAKHQHLVHRAADGRVAVEVHRIAGMGHGVPVVDGSCGHKGDFLLDAGVCSSLYIAAFWGIAPR